MSQAGQTPSGAGGRAPRADLVERLARGQGLALLGVAPAEPPRRGPFLRQWLAEGRQGDMDYLAEALEERLDPRRLLPGARSIICVAVEHPAGPAEGADDAGRVARYAWGPDYHRTLKKRLHALADALREAWPEHQFRSAVDTAPVMEREHAQAAGLGWIGKHTLLIHRQRGSWLLLGQIITTLGLQTAAERGAAPMADHCGTCTRCLEACPTGCLTPYQIDARRCISYLTIEHRGLIDPALHPVMGQWLAGCDVCQEVCPFNHAGGPRQGMGEPAGGGVSPSAGTAGGEGGLPRAFSLLEVLNWNEDRRRAAVWRSALKRINLEQFKRNALIAAGNLLARSPRPDLRLRIEQLASEPTESNLVRQTARQVLERLANAAAAGSLPATPPAPPA